LLSSGCKHLWTLDGKSCKINEIEPILFWYPLHFSLALISHEFFIHSRDYITTHKSGSTANNTARNDFASSFAHIMYVVHKITNSSANRPTPKTPVNAASLVLISLEQTPTK
jgi:hypothetical protein